MFKIIILLLTFSQIHASYFDDDGSFQIEWFAHNSEAVRERISDKVDLYDDEFFLNWFNSRNTSSETVKLLLGSKFEEVTSSDTCEKNALDCYIITTFGYQKSLRMFYLVEKYGYNPSHFYKNRDFKAEYDEFTLEEMNDIVVAFSFYERSVLPSFRQNFIRVVNFEAGDSLANARIHLYKKWRELESEDRVAVIVHELGHSSGYGRSSTGRSHQNTIEWQRIYNSGCNISRYSMANKYEGFAEAASMYKLHPEVLKAVCPAKYYFMKDVFKGK